VSKRSRFLKTANKELEQRNKKEQGPRIKGRLRATSFHIPPQRGSTGSKERTERIRPLIKSSGHSSSNSSPTLEV